MKVQKLSESFDMTKVSPCVLSEALLLEADIAALSPAQQKALNKQDKRNKKLEKKSGKVLARDFDRVCARATFYIDHNYSKGMNQAQWRNWIESEQTKINDSSKTPENKQAAAQEKLNARIHNAIVVDDTNYYIRRGSEWLLHSGEPFNPGVNDKIGSGYFIDPYKYSGKTAPKATGAPKPKSAGGGSGTKKAGKITPTNFKKFQQFAKLTGIQLFDADKKEVKIDAAEHEKLATYTIKMGSVEMPALEWLEAVKKSKPV